MIPSSPLVVAPSLLAADFGQLADSIDLVSEETPWLHLDVMDGHFVPNLTIGPPVIASLRRHSDLYFDCHLMMTNPGQYLSSFKEAGADLCSIHVEVGDTAEHIAMMRSIGLDVGLVLSPDTPFSAAAPFLSSIDLLLIMSVHPGFGGQRFMDSVLAKVAEARRAIDGGGYDIALEIDGGIDAETAIAASAAGARVFVAGSAVFSHHSPALGVSEIRRAALSAMEDRK